ncbi:Serine/threonine-protein kinase pknB [Nocardia otitidiscaviarum]|uniref:non-specific serine/threonine protein kinase n=1 Tax=Nocardia otitidiscaviarum TaxID=1823 RepID=A0A379JK01_9NOCA|nr:serine/threonine-protein kinase [Nocardia otitidiscaviarum]SUD48828.1 Serine/threonine-protein kinase pknB [Nocardia otitidiscaviarum]
MTADRLIAGRYRLTDPIGTGAMGVVWRATDVRLRRTVAVKQLLLGPGLSRSQAIEARMRAMREGRIAARLHHVNAVTVFDVAEEDGQPWLVMEYVNAPSLAAVMREQGPLPPTQVARIGAKVAAALAAAHDAGIVHRDVKPANILVADDGTVKITDFGISRAVGDVTVTSTGFLAGTPAYLSPEVARGENPEPSSDVFALGSTLYAAVEGTPPFGEGENPLAVLHSVARARVPEARRAGPLGPVLMELLAAEADARPTMKQAHEALEAVAEGRGVPAHAHPNPTKVLPTAAAVSPDAAETTVLTNSHGVTGNSTDPTMHVDMGTPARHTGAGTSERPASGPLPVVPNSGAAQGTRRDRRRLALAGVGVVAALLLAAVIATTVNRGGGVENPPVATGTSEVAPPVAGTSSAAPTSPAVIGQADSQEPSRTAAPTTTTAPPSTTTSANPTTTTVTTTPTTTPPTTTPAPPNPGNVSAFVRNYYGMLPGNVSGAWSMLSPSYQAVTGGYNSYAQFWGTIAEVRVGAVTPQGDNRAVVSITYVLKNGSTDSENRWIQVDNSGGRMLITASGL